MSIDYSTKCRGDAPLNLLQMLASCIVGYHDIAGLLHYRLNGLESAGPCTALSNFLKCSKSHIDPERQLVENAFYLDNCSRLGIKVFSNSDNDWIDYSKCIEVPQTLIQMLARCIVIDANITLMNAVVDEVASCGDITALVNCSTNNIEAERLLVTNIFATDDCGHLLIKILANTSTMTDYTIRCAQERQSFYQMLARCIVLYNGHYYLNVASVAGDCTDLHDFWTCANNHVDPENALVDNLFATDSCGNLALKIFNQEGARQ